MLVVAKVLSVLAVALTVVAIDSWRVHVLPWGFEGTLFVIGASFALAALAALVALAIVALRARSGRKAEFGQVAWPSGLCLLALGILAMLGTK